MKYILLISLSFLCWLPSKSQIVSIKMTKVGFNLDIAESEVSCDNFYEDFRDDTASFFIKNPSLQRRIVNSIKQSTVADGFTGIDTRARMFIKYRSGKIDSLCFGSTQVFIWNNKIMMLPDISLIHILDTFRIRKKTERVMTEHDRLESYVRDTTGEREYEREQDSMRRNPLHCYLMELALDNKDVDSFLRIDSVDHLENITIFNGPTYFSNCSFTTKYKAIKFLKMPEPEEKKKYKFYYYITYFNWDQWEKGKYTLDIYNDEKRSVEVHFQKTNGVWAVSDYRFYD